MSRVEELLKAIDDNSDVIFTPDSRVEKILYGRLTGDMSDIEPPKSRVEELLCDVGFKEDVGPILDNINGEVV